MRKIIKRDSNENNVKLDDNLSTIMNPILYTTIANEKYK